MTYRIVSDSSCDIRTLPGAEFYRVPLRIITDRAEYVDDAELDTQKMTAELQRYKGRSSTACPNVADWEAAFGDAACVFALTITSGLSGSCNAALSAAASYEAAHPGRQVCVIDSLSTGPEMVLILEKLRELVAAELPFEKIAEEIAAYQRGTHLLFLLSSIQNLARNGRASKLGADAVGLLGIRIYGQASPEGKLDVLGKCRGEKTGLERLVQQMERQGWRGGKVRIAHCQNPAGAERLRGLLLRKYPNTDITIYPTGGLCSFYAEVGGFMVGYET